MFRLLIVYPMKPTNQVRVSLLCTESTQAWSHSPCESAASGFFWSDHCHQSRGWGLCATQRLCPGTTGHTAEERTVADVSCELENQMVAWLIFWSSANLLSAPLPLAVLWRTPYLLDCSNRIHINICVWACLGFDLWWGSNHVCSCYAEADGAGYWERKCYTTLALPLTFRHRCSKFQRWMLMVTIPCFFFSYNALSIYSSIRKTVPKWLQQTISTFISESHFNGWVSGYKKSASVLYNCTVDFSYVQGKKVSLNKEQFRHRLLEATREKPDWQRTY